MSYIALVKQTTTPPTPTSGKTRLYMGPNYLMRSIDDEGNVTEYSPGLTAEQVQDIIGESLISSTSAQAVYNDTDDEISFNVLPGGVDHNSLLNYVANKHVDHSAVSITAGSGLTGGGDLTATRTLALTTTGVTATTYGSATQGGTFTVDAYGRLTSASNTTIAIASSQVTDFAESVDDRVAALLVAGDLILLTYNDAGNTLTVACTFPFVNSPPPNASGQFIVWDSSTSKWHPTTGGWAFDFSTSPTNGQLIQYTNTGSRFSMTGAPVSDGQFLRWNASGTGQWQAYTLVASMVTDFNEATQDAVGGILTDSSSIDFTYNDAGNTITAIVIPAGVNHNSLLNYSVNRHIDHSAVSIAAGSGLTGGGDLTDNRTISMPSLGTAGTYGDSSHYPVITTDAYGRVTGVSLQLVSINVWTLTADGLEWNDTNGLDLIIEQVNNDPGQSPFMQQRKARGTLLSRSFLASGDKIGGWGWMSWAGGAYNSSSTVELAGYATENHSASGNGGELRVYTTAKGTTTNSLALTIQDSGLVSLNNAIRPGDTNDTTNGNIRLNNNEVQIRQNGSWYVVGTTPLSISDTSSTSTTSSTWSIINTMQTTPAAGTYIVMFNADVIITSDSNGDVTLFIAGTEQTVCRRNIGCNVSGGGSATLNTSVSIVTTITVNGTNIVSIQWRENGFGTFTCSASQLILIPYMR